MSRKPLLPLSWHWVRQGEDDWFPLQADKKGLYNEVYQVGPRVMEPDMAVAMQTLIFACYTLMVVQASIFTNEGKTVDAEAFTTMASRLRSVLMRMGEDE